MRYELFPPLTLLLGLLEEELYTTECAFRLPYTAHTRIIREINGESAPPPPPLPLPPSAAGY